MTDALPALVAHAFSAHLSPLSFELLVEPHLASGQIDALDLGICLLKQFSFSSDSPLLNKYLLHLLSSNVVPAARFLASFGSIMTELSHHVKNTTFLSGMLDRMVHVIQLYFDRVLDSELPACVDSLLDFVVCAVQLTPAFEPSLGYTGKLATYLEVIRTVLKRNGARISTVCAACAESVRRLPHSNLADTEDELVRRQLKELYSDCSGMILHGKAPRQKERSCLDVDRKWRTLFVALESRYKSDLDVVFAELYRSRLMDDLDMPTALSCLLADCVSLAAEGDAQSHTPEVVSLFVHTHLRPLIASCELSEIFRIPAPELPAYHDIPFDAALLRFQSVALIEDPLLVDFPRFLFGSQVFCSLANHGEVLPAVLQLLDTAPPLQFCFLVREACQRLHVLDALHSYGQLDGVLLRLLGDVDVSLRSPSSHFHFGLVICSIVAILSHRARADKFAVPTAWVDAHVLNERLRHVLYLALGAAREPLWTDVALLDRIRGWLQSIASSTSGNASEMTIVPPFDPIDFAISVPLVVTLSLDQLIYNNLQSPKSVISFPPRRYLLAAPAAFLVYSRYMLWVSGTIGKMMLVQPPTMKPLLVDSLVQYTFEFVTAVQKVASCAVLINTRIIAENLRSLRNLFVERTRPQNAVQQPNSVTLNELVLKDDTASCWFAVVNKIHRSLQYQGPLECLCNVIVSATQLLGEPSDSDGGSPLSQRRVLCLLDIVALAMSRHVDSIESANSAANVLLRFALTSCNANADATTFAANLVRRIVVVDHRGYLYRCLLERVRAMRDRIEAAVSRYANVQRKTVPILDAITHALENATLDVDLGNSTSWDAVLGRKVRELVYPVEPKPVVEADMSVENGPFDNPPADDMEALAKKEEEDSAAHDHVMPLPLPMSMSLHLEKGTSGGVDGLHASPYFTKTMLE